MKHMSTYHVALRLMDVFNFSGGEFSDNDLADIGNDNSYKPDKGKGNFDLFRKASLSWL